MTSTIRKQGAMNAAAAQHFVSIQQMLVMYLVYYTGGLWANGNPFSLEFLLPESILSCRLVTSRIATRDSLYSNWWRQRQRFTDKHYAELWESCIRAGGGIVSARGVRMETTETTNLSSQELMDTEQHSESLYRTGLGPLHVCVCVS